MKYLNNKSVENIYKLIKMSIKQWRQVHRTIWYKVNYVIRFSVSNKLLFSIRKNTSDEFILILMSWIQIMIIKVIEFVFALPFDGDRNNNVANNYTCFIRVIFFQAVLSFWIGNRLRLWGMVEFMRKDQKMMCAKLHPCFLFWKT